MELHRVVDLASAVRWRLGGPDWSSGTHTTWGIDLEDQLSASVGYRVAPWRRNQGVASHALAAVT